MSTLTITKKSNLVWLHEPSDKPKFIIGKFTFHIDGDFFQIVEIGQSKRNKYRYSDITIVDEVNSDTFSSFANITELSEKLAELGYLGFDTSYSTGVVSVNGFTGIVLLTGNNFNVTNPHTSASSSLNQALEDVYNNAGGGGSETLQQILENGATYTANGKTLTIYSDLISIFDNGTLSSLEIGMGDGPENNISINYTPNAGGQTELLFPKTESTENVAYQSYVDTGLSDKVDKVAGKQLSTEDYTTTEKSKLSGIASGATANDTDANLKNRANHTGSQAISTITGLQTELDGKDIKNTELNLLNDYALSSITTAQKLFNVGTSGNGAFSLDANSLYEFEMFVYLDNLSTTSSNFSFQILGTATYSNILLKTEAIKQAFITGSIFNGIITATTSYQLVTNSTASTGFIKITGSFRTSSAGTFIPSIILSVANAAIVKKGSNAKIKKIGTDTFTATSGIS